MLGKRYFTGDMFSLCPFASVGVEAVPRVYIRAGRISFSRTFKNWAFKSSSG